MNQNDLSVKEYDNTQKLQLINEFKNVYTSLFGLIPQFILENIDVIIKNTDQNQNLKKYLEIEMKCAKVLLILAKFNNLSSKIQNP